MTRSVWPAPGKINLFLHIIGRRSDGYHELQTVFQFLDYADRIRLEARDDGEIRRLQGPPGVTPEDDLSVRAARALQSLTGVSRGVDIGIDKLLPLGGGLGGGSSDAATVLVALNRLWRLDLDVAQLAALGLSLGADVPVFVHGVAAWAEGVGERLTPIEPAERWALVIHPGCAVSTREVFTHPDLTRDTPPIRMHAFSSLAYRNDCEVVVRRLYPEVGRAISWLEQFGEARLTGTGACVYLLLETWQDASRISAQVPPCWHWFIARTLNRSPLYDGAAGALAEQA